METTVSAVKSPRADRVSWDRKRTAIQLLIDESNQIGSDIMDLVTQQVALADRINVIRGEMIAECIHPIDHVVIRADGTQLCKFCERAFVTRSNTHVPPPGQ